MVELASGEEASSKVQGLHYLQHRTASMHLAKMRPVLQRSMEGSTGATAPAARPRSFI